MHDAQANKDFENSPCYFKEPSLLGCALGCELGCLLGCLLGCALGFTLGCELGWMLGCVLGCVLGRRPALPSPARARCPQRTTPLGAANSLTEDIRWCQVLCHRSTLTSA